MRSLTESPYLEKYLASGLFFYNSVHVGLRFILNHSWVKHKLSFPMFDIVFD